MKLAKERFSAKKEKNFSKSDEIRNLLLEKGYAIADRADGYDIKKV